MNVYNILLFLSEYEELCKYEIKQMNKNMEIQSSVDKSRNLYICE